MQRRNDPVDVDVMQQAVERDRRDRNDQQADRVTNPAPHHPLCRPRDDVHRILIGLPKREGHATT
jgi:hypothetical protein